MRIGVGLWLCAIAVSAMACGGGNPAAETAASGSFDVYAMALTAGDAAAGTAVHAASGVSPQLPAHRALKQSVAQWPPAERQAMLEGWRLDDDLDSEECTIYVHHAWADADLAALERDGMHVIRGLYVPPVPSHRHPHGFHIARIPYAQLDRVAADPNVVRIDSHCYPARTFNDVTRLATHIDEVHAGTGLTARTGAGAKVCIADSGLDLSLTDLPTIIETYDTTSGDTVNNWSTNVVPNDSFHGTHVVGTAVGTGGYSGGLYKGMAPGANLYFYKVGTGGDFVSTTGFIKAMSRAIAVGCDVFSLSAGSVAVDFDGSGPESQAVDAMTAQGIVATIAAGNEANNNQHLSITLAPNASANFSPFYNNNSASSKSINPNIVIAWRSSTPGASAFLFVNNVYWSSVGSLTTSDRGTDQRQYSRGIVSIPANSGLTWPTTIQNTSNETLTFHIYTLSGLRINPSSWDTTLNSPGLADTAFTVAAWSSRWLYLDWLGGYNPVGGGAFDLGVADFSSRGPRIDGVAKPDIAAPGSHVISLLDGVNVPKNPLVASEIIDDDGLTLNGSGPSHYMVMSGTSMAAPAVAGAIALLREAYPNENGYNLQVRLMETAHDSNNAGPYDEGYGLMDVKAAILAATCGNGQVEGNEACDDGNLASGDCCSFLCQWEVMCEDGNKCTVQDSCDANHACQPGSPKKCDDANPCTGDACVPATGCTHLPLSGGGCDDGNACTSDSCSFGQCFGLPKLCVDGNACTDDGCNSLTGNCTYTNNAVPCDDSLPCTVSDHCQGGACAGGGANTCDDANICTTDSCNPAYGCDHSPYYGACDDGNPCTIYDGCGSLGVCKGAAMPCDDGNPCTSDSCAAGQCVFKPVVCDDKDPCTDDICSPQQGGACYSTAKFCLDSTECTTDSCDPVTGECLHAPLSGTPCLDPYWCTKGDTCKAGTCLGIPLVCDDGLLCTDDYCDEPSGGKCGTKPNTLPCDDGNLCTEGDACSNGACLAGGAKVCNDGNPCTFDKCDAGQGGCVFELPFASFPPCDDGEPCSANDFCANGVCVGGGPAFCTDNNPCTNDSCTLGVGCVFTTGGTAGCDDANPCTNDSCANSACSHVANDAASCVDGNFCTSGEHCAGGTCVTTPTSCDDGNACTADSCGYVQGNPAGACIHTIIASDCDDGSACTMGDICAAGACASGAVVPCGDGNDCTADSCVPATGCIHPFNTVACQDGNACTTGDQCQNGGCQGGAMVNCDDGNPCTAESCLMLVGCIPGPIDGACDDGSVCTTGDTCSAGTCGGTATDCNDGNPCTIDVCIPASGCSHLTSGGPCDDGNPCTLNDGCSQGACVGTADPACAADASDSVGSADAADTEDSVDAADTPDTADAADTMDPVDAADAADTADSASDSADASDAAPDVAPDSGADADHDVDGTFIDAPEQVDANLPDADAPDAEPEILGYSVQASEAPQGGAGCSSGRSEAGRGGWRVGLLIAAAMVVWRRRARAGGQRG